MAAPPTALNNLDRWQWERHDRYLLAPIGNVFVKKLVHGVLCSWIEPFQAGYEAYNSGQRVPDLLANKSAQKEDKKNPDGNCGQHYFSQLERGRNHELR